MLELVQRLFRVFCLQDVLPYPVVELRQQEVEAVEEVDRQLKLQQLVFHNRLQILEVPRDFHEVEVEVEAEEVLRVYKPPVFHSSKLLGVPRAAKEGSTPTLASLFRLEIRERERAKEMMVLQERKRGPVEQGIEEDPFFSMIFHLYARTVTLSVDVLSKERALAILAALEEASSWLVGFMIIHPPVFFSCTINRV